MESKVVKVINMAISTIDAMDLAFIGNLAHPSASCSFARRFPSTFLSIIRKLIFFKRTWQMYDVYEGDVECKAMGEHPSMKVSLTAAQPLYDLYQLKVHHEYPGVLDACVGCFVLGRKRIAQQYSRSWAVLT